MKTLLPIKNLFFAVLIISLLAAACGKAAPPTTTLEVRSVYPTIALEQGRSFDVDVTIANTGQYNARVTQIQLPASFMNAVQYDGSTPALTLTRNAAGDGLVDMDLTIAPGGAEKFTFRFTATNPGSLSGLGMVVSDAGNYQFHTRAEVRAGVNPPDYDPGVSAEPTPTEVVSLPPTPTATTIPIEKIPYRSVVQIKALVELDGQIEPGWWGSGTIISADGLILTNAHVVLSDRFYEVKDLVISLTVAQDSPPVDTYLASIVQANAALDVAVIKIRADINNNPIDTASLNLPFVPLGDSDTLQLGDRLTIIGYPGIGGETVTLTQGEVSGFTAEEAFGNRAYVKTSATIAGGNSGGLAVNENGELVGIPTQVGSGGTDEFVDCRPLADTNRDGYIDEYDSCVPTGGFINALRPVNLALPFINDAKQGIVLIDAGMVEEVTYEESTGQVLFSDDFSTINPAWSIGSSDAGLRAIEDGKLTIHVTTDNYLVWSDIDYVYDNVILAAEAWVINSVGDADFGFICGLQDNEHFTVLEISEDGYFTIWKQVGPEFVTLVDWTYSEAIAGGGPYGIAAHCGTDSLILAANEVLLTEYVDPDFVPGTVGMIAGTFDTPGFKIGFDNFELSLP